MKPKTCPFVQVRRWLLARYPMCKAGRTIVLTGSSTPITVAISATATGCASLAAPRIQRSEHHAWETCPCRSDFESFRGCGLGADGVRSNHQGSVLHRDDHDGIGTQGFLRDYRRRLELQDYVH